MTSHRSRKGQLSHLDEIICAPLRLWNQAKAEAWNRAHAQLFPSSCPAPLTTFSVSLGNLSLSDSWQVNHSLKVSFWEPDLRARQQKGDG